MAKVLVKDLSGNALDWAVAQLEGYTLTSDGISMLLQRGSELRILGPNSSPLSYSPSTNWMQGGSFIDRDGIMFQSGVSYEGEVIAYLRSKGTSGPRSNGSTHLVAASRCKLVAAHGPEMEIPDVLLYAVESNASVSEVRSDVSQPADHRYVDGATLVHAGYLMTGFFEKGNLSEVEADGFGGQIGAAIQVTGFANTIARALAEIDRLGIEYPGVFDYEVTEGMGAWFRQHIDATETEFCVELVRQMEIFFECECTQIAAVLMPDQPVAAKLAVSSPVVDSESPAP